MGASWGDPLCSAQDEEEGETLPEFAYGKKPHKVPRFGIDLGGVLCKHNNDVAEDTSKWFEDPESEAPEAMASVAEIVKLFGPENVFIVSKLKLGSKMETQSRTWLFQTMDICTRTGLLEKNIYFVNDYTGLEGKGVMAAKLGLSHFVDDKDINLKTIYEDTVGNSQSSIARHRGLLFHFRRSGLLEGKPPRPSSWAKEDRPANVVAVTHWPELMTKLRASMKQVKVRATSAGSSG